MSLKTYRTIPAVPQVRSNTPLHRETALEEGDWESAYTLACREERVKYIASPPRKPRTRAPARSRSPRSDKVKG